MTAVSLGSNLATPPGLVVSMDLQWEKLYINLGKHKAKSFYILYVVMFVSPYYKLCQPCHWGQMWPRPWGCLHRLTIESNSKFNISKGSWWTLIKLHTQHDWAVGKVAYCFEADRTGTLFMYVLIFNISKASM